MLRNVSKILNFVLLAKDGEIGRCYGGAILTHLC